MALFDLGHSDLLFLADLEFEFGDPGFLLLKDFLFLSVFPSFPRILGVRQQEKIHAVLVGFALLFQNGKERRSGQLGRDVVLLQAVFTKFSQTFGSRDCDAGGVREWDGSKKVGPRDCVSASGAYK